MNLLWSIVKSSDHISILFFRFHSSEAFFPLECSSALYLTGGILLFFRFILIYLVYSFYKCNFLINPMSLVQRILHFKNYFFIFVLSHIHYPRPQYTYTDKRKNRKKYMILCVFVYSCVLEYFTHFSFL